MTFFLKHGNNTFPFNGENPFTSSPYHVFFPKGKYFLELYGASGGGDRCGKGGYTSGFLTLKSSKHLYLYVGGKGTVNPNSGTKQCLSGGWNGGGEACSLGYQSSGGGGTDIRLSQNNDYNERIIVAGGGGGDGDGVSNQHYQRFGGGDGGGTIGGSSYGESGSSHISYGSLYAHGGTQSKGGVSVHRTNNSWTNEDGKVGVGGKCVGGDNYCGAGGGGYFGGGGGYDVTGGGGGSSYIDPLYISRPKLLKSEHVGNGVIFITQIIMYSNCNSINLIKCFPLFAIILVK